MGYMKQFSKDENGQGLLEYVLIISLIAVAAIISVELMGIVLGNLYSIIKEAIASVS